MCKLEFAFELLNRKRMNDRIRIGTGTDADIISIAENAIRSTLNSFQISMILLYLVCSVHCGHGLCFVFGVPCFISHINGWTDH